jgi:hypothetical protein
MVSDFPEVDDRVINSVTPRLGLSMEDRIQSIFRSDLGAQDLSELPRKDFQT